MPVARNAKTLSTKQPRAGKGAPVTENVPPEKVRPGWAVGRGGPRSGVPPAPPHPALLQEESCQAKRSPSSPQGGPKKRSAFGDLTNVSASLWGGGCAALLAAPQGSPHPFSLPSLFPPPQNQAHKNQAVAGKKDGVKSAPRKALRAPTATGVAKNNEVNLKK